MVQLIHSLMLVEHICTVPYGLGLDGRRGVSSCVQVAYDVQRAAPYGRKSNGSLGGRSVKSGIRY